MIKKGGLLPKNFGDLPPPFFHFKGEIKKKKKVWGGGGAGIFFSPKKFKVFLKKIDGGKANFPI